MKKKLLSGITVLFFLLVNITPQFAQGPAYLAAVKTDSFWGYIDTTGAMQIPALMDEAYPFHNDLAAVRMDERFAYINNKGIINVAPLFIKANSFNNNRALVYLGSIEAREAYGAYIDKKRHIYYTLQPYELGWDYHDGLARIRTADSFGFIFGYLDTMGNWAIEAQYEAAGDFNDGLATVKVDGKWGYINQNNKLVIPARYNMAVSFFNGAAYAETDKQKGFIDKQGNWIFTVDGKDGQIDYLFQEDMVGITKDGRTGYLNKKGKLVISHQFDNGRPYPFSGGLAAAAKKNKNGKLLWGYINTSGKWVVQPQFEEAGNFFHGFARIKQNGKWGYINRKGEVVVKPKYHQAQNFSPGF